MCISKLDISNTDIYLPIFLVFNKHSYDNIYKDAYIWNYFVFLRLKKSYKVNLDNAWLNLSLISMRNIPRKKPQT